MKTKILILLLFLSFTCNLFSKNTNWTKVDTRYDYDTTLIRSDYLDLKCYDSLNCMAWALLSGAGGYYFRQTTDGGNSWKNVLMDSSYFYDMDNYKFVPEVKFISYPGPNLFIAVGDSGLIVRGTENCTKWSKVQLNDSIEFYRIFMANERFGIIQASYYNSYNSINYLTSDSGKSWNLLVKKINLNQLNFLNVDSLYGISYYYDKDSVYHWCIKLLTNNYTKVDTFEVPSEVGLLKVVDNKTAWMAGGTFDYPNYKNYTQKIVNTLDGFKTWSIQRYGKYNGCPIEQINFYDAKYGIASSCQGQVMVTFDGGNSWEYDTLGTLKDFRGFAGDSYGLQVPSSTTAFIIVNRDFIYKYTRDTTTDVSESELRSEGVFPNPASDYIIITLPSDAHTLKGVVEDVRLYDVFGQEATPALSINGEGVSMDVSTLPAGVYFVRVGAQVSKFVKI